MGKDTLLHQNLSADIKELIEASKQKVALTVNAEMTTLYWHIGTRINKEILEDRRAEYGKHIIESLAKELIGEYGVSFSVKNLRRMMQFAEEFTDEKIVVTLIRQLSWSHILAIIPIKEQPKREFYIQMCINERWSVRTFRERIDSMLFERTAISKKPDETISNELKLLESEQKISPDLVFRDPYFLDFLGLSDSYSEKDLESAILAELQKFIIELGNDFAFMARQKRITIDNDDYYIDLLFYHRRLKSLIAIDLKLDKFRAAYKGQMELYLRWLEKNEMIEGENLPIGLILCADKNEEHIELLRLEDSNIKVAQYLTKIPNLEILEQKLHLAIQKAKEKLSQKELMKDNTNV